MAFFGADAIERKYGLEPPQDWTAAVESLGDAQLRAGIEALSKSALAFPPTLPQFVSMCRSSREFTTGFRAIGYEREDAWAVAANTHLAAYLFKRNALRYSPDGDANSRVTRERTLCVVRAKNRWAQTMRETAEGGHVDVETQKGFWTVEMDRAEEEIDALMAQQKAA